MHIAAAECELERIVYVPLVLKVDGSLAEKGMRCPRSRLLICEPRSETVVPIELFIVSIDDGKKLVVADLSVVSPMAVRIVIETLAVVDAALNGKVIFLTAVFSVVIYSKRQAIC